MSEPSTNSTGASSTPLAASRASPSRARRSASALGALAVVALMLVSALAVIGGASASPTVAGTLASTTLPVSTTQSALHASAASSAGSSAPKVSQPAGVLPAASSGRGTFFESHAVANPPTGTNTCPYAYFCWNNTNEPSANVTTSGYTGVAYTAYTNQSPCRAMVGNSSVPDADTEVGFIVSPDFGTTWSNPIYVGNPVCTGGGANYSSAFQPSLTSLPNGTFAMAYIEYNYSSQSTYSYTAPPENMYCGNYYHIDYARLVMAFSYNNGTSWSTPTVVNETNLTSCPQAGFPDLRPSITAIGDTIYATWETVEKPLYYCCSTTVSGSVEFAYSNDSGLNWSKPVTLTTVSGYDYSYSDTTQIAGNPNILVAPNGRVFVAYTTGLGSTYVTTPCCSYNYTATIEVATTTNNGTTFTYAAATKYAQWVDLFYPSTYFDPEPYLAYSTVTGEVYVTYAAGLAGNYCLNEGVYGFYCSTYYQGETIFVQDSTNNASSWSAPDNVLPSSMINPNGGWYSSAYNPSIAVDDRGTVHLQFSFLNAAVCTPGTDQCHLAQQFYMNSTDGGLTWTSPVTVYPYASEMPFDYGRYYFYSPWPGTYSSMVTAGDKVMLAWTLLNCPAFSYCYFAYGTGGSEVVTSTLFEGTGISLTFSETGLPSGASWSASVQYNQFTATAGSTITVSGVPPSQVVQFNVDEVNTSYGVNYYATLSSTSPTSFAASTTVTATYTEQVLVNVLTVPPIEYYYLQYGYANYTMSPAPSATWVALGTSISESISPHNYATSFCYICLNLSFQSWTGIGNGSVSTTNDNVTFTANGPINETANFLFLAWCRNTAYGGGCMNLTFPLTFEENGLPNGTNWGVSIGNSATGPWTYYNSTGPAITVDASAGPVYYTLWTIPDGSSNFWIPSTKAIDPLNAVTSPLVKVSYSASAASSGDFPTEFVATGLPNGTAWSLELGSTSIGVTTSTTLLTLSGGTSYSVNGSAVYMAGGTGYYASSVEYLPFVMNETQATSKAPGTFVLNGSAIVEIVYSPMYYLTVTSSVGGSVTPGSQWVDRGRSVALNETPSQGYHFVGWTGAGSGAVSTGTVNPTVSPLGPVTELGTFRPNLPPTWNLTVNASGLPAGVPLSVSVGGVTYTGVGPFKVGNLTNGTYAVSAPTVYLNSSDTTRFVVTSISSSLTITAGSMALVANGTLSVAYATEYAASLVATPGGTISSTLGGPGTYWFAGATPTTLTAVPSAGFSLTGWNGTGAGSVNSTALVITVTPAGPITETAQFLPTPIPPPTVYSLTVAQTGLPATVSWSVSVGTTGATGTGSSLVIAGLNGTYKLTAPAVYTGTGTRWISNTVNVSTSVSTDTTVTVAYSEQFFVSVNGGTGGTVSASAWVNASSQVTLSATPSTGQEFVSWNGTGAGWTNTTTPSPTVTVTGPLSVQATFAPIPPPPAKVTSTTSSSTGMLLSFGLLAALLVVGLVIGILLARRGGRQPPAPMQEYGAEAPAEPAPQAESPAEQPYDEGAAPPSG